MTTPAQRSARLELDAARPVVARLDGTRGPEDLAADLLDTWSAVEASLRSLVGSTVLSGQPLIREARQRQLLNFDQANALAEFQAARDRVQHPGYRPTEADLNAARAAFLKLDTALMTDNTAEATRVMSPPQTPRTTGGPAAAAPDPLMDAGPVAVVAPPPRFPMWLVATASVVLIAVVGLFVWHPWSRGSGGALQEGIEAYNRGQREAAVSAFNRAAREDKNATMPHVYLARMAREVGNFTLADQELQSALQIDPGDEIALREMGANLLQQNNFDLARRFYVRAVQANPQDKMAIGYLGCTLMRLNRTQEAQTFLTRAGPGPWSNCTPAPASSAAGQTAPTGQSPKPVPR